MSKDKIALFFSQVDALATPEEKITALKDALTASNDAADLLQANLDTANETIVNLKDQYTALETESTTEIKRLSEELAFATSKEGRSTLSVTVNEKRYASPAGRVYDYKGKKVAIEDLVKDTAACADLIAKKSGIFKPVTE